MDTARIARHCAFFYLFIAFALISLASCGPLKKGLAGKSEHEKYGERLNEAGLQLTELGRLWFNAANKSLMQPQAIILPFKETGYFPPESPGAAGYIFSLRRGEQVRVSVAVVSSVKPLFFTELWDAGSAGNPKFIAAADNSNLLVHEANKAARYIVRIQAELLRGVEYTITMVTEPSLAYPVDKSGKPRIISAWGVGRDNGTRTHEGIDIGAPAGTPVLAVADGFVSHVTENILGGKVIFLRPANKDYTIYYAHLNKQMVQSGQKVTLGKTIGLVGNTGNASKTVPHLHFGIYSNGGAIDPQPFVESKAIVPPEIKAPANNMNKFMRSKTSTLYDAPSIKSNKLMKLSEQVVRIMSATSDWYKVSLPAGFTGFIPADQLTIQPLQNKTLPYATRLLDEPSETAAAKRTLEKGSVIAVIGRNNNFYFVHYNDEKGWIAGDQNF